MNYCILDASVAIKWFFREEELVEQADALLHSHTSFIVPDYFYLEMNSVFTKLVRQRYLTADEVWPMNQALRSLPADILETLKFRDLSMELSIQMNIGFYDCLYVVPACISKIPLITADRRLYNAFQKSEMAPCVLWLGEVSPFQAGA